MMGKNHCTLIVSNSPVSIIADVVVFIKEEFYA